MQLRSRGSQLRRVSFVVEDLELFDLINVGLLGTEAVVTSAFSCEPDEKFGNGETVVSQ